MAVVQAASQLIRELDGLGLKGKVEILDERDGLGFQRQIRLSKAITDGLGKDVLAALEKDQRIDQIVHSPKGARIVFVSDPRADFRTPYGLASVVE
jgi:hypothetical protein